MMMSGRMPGMPWMAGATPRASLSRASNLSSAPTRCGRSLAFGRSLWRSGEDGNELLLWAGIGEASIFRWGLVPRDDNAWLERVWIVYGFMDYEQRMNYLLATLMYCLVYFRCKRGLEDGWEWSDGIGLNGTWAL